MRKKERTHIYIGSFQLKFVHLAYLVAQARFLECFLPVRIAVVFINVFFEALAATTPEVVYEYIRSVSYPNNKAKHLVGMAQMLVKDFNSQVPDTLEKLVKLPGVGRKTANVIQSVVFNKAAMAVDTHVFRVSHRLGLVSDKCTTPFSVEKELVKYIPETEIPIAHHWLILHGRYVCQARTPQCDNCGLQLMCKYYCRKYKVSKESNDGEE